MKRNVYSPPCHSTFATSRIETVEGAASTIYIYIYTENTYVYTRYADMHIHAGEAVLPQTPGYDTNLGCKASHPDPGVIQRLPIINHSLVKLLHGR